jgi:hypothetical protein
MGQTVLRPPQETFERRSLRGTIEPLIINQ